MARASHGPLSRVPQAVGGLPAGIFPALTSGADVLTDGLVRDVLVLVQFWRRHQTTGQKA
jgi:hypothetical protein